MNLLSFFATFIDIEGNLLVWGWRIAERQMDTSLGPPPSGHPAIQSSSHVSSCSGAAEVDFSNSPLPTGWC